MKEYCFTHRIQKFTLDESIEVRKFEVFQVNAKGETTSSYKTPITKKNDSDEEKAMLAMSSLAFHLNLFMRMEKNLSSLEMVIVRKTIGEKIYEWIEELDSIKHKVKVEFHSEYKAFYVELWEFYEYVTNLQSLKKKRGGRPKSKYVEFKDCLNLKPDEYEKFLKAMVNYIHDGIWVSQNKSDYINLLEALTELKFIRKYAAKPFARAFCKSFKIDFETFSYRINVDAKSKKDFISLLEDIRIKPTKAE